MADEDYTVLDAQQVMERADALRDLAHNRRYGDLIKQYRQVLMQNHPADVPEAMARGVVTEMPSPIPLQVQRGVIAETSAYPQYINVVATSEEGAPSAKAKDEADYHERWLTLADQKMDAAKRATMAVRGRQCSAGWTAVVQTTDPAREWPWSWDVPDPLTCFPDEQVGGTYVPNEMAMRYMLPIREIEKRYKDKDGPFKGQELRMKGKRFCYVPLGEPRSAEDGDHTGAGGARGGIRDAEFVRYDDGCYIYHVVKQPGKAKGDAEMLWYERNLTGGVSAVIVPGDVNVEGGDGQRMLPILIGILTNTLHINLMRAVLATLAFRDRPDTYVEVTPTQLETMRNAGYAVPVEGDWQQGGAPRQIYVDGKPTMWSVAPNPQLDTLLNELTSERQFLLAQYTTVQAPDVVQSSTAEAFHLNTGAQNRQQYPMLMHWDKAKELLLGMIMHTIPEIDSSDEEGYADAYSVVALDDVPRNSGGKVEKGFGLTMDASKVKDFAKRFVIHVATKQETEEQRAIRVQQKAWEEQNGLATHEQAVAAAVTDVAAQMEELGTEKALVRMEATGEALLDPAFSLWLALNGDVNLPVGAMPMLGPQPVQAPPGTGGYQPKPAAMTAMQNGNGAVPVG